MTTCTPLESSQLAGRKQDRTTLAYVIHSMNVGGAERSIARLVNALDPNRFRSIIICLTHSGPAADWIKSSEVPVIEINKNSSAFDRNALHRFAKTLISHNVDIVHSHNWGTLIESTLACRMAGRPAHIHAERGTVLGRVEIQGFRMRLRGLFARWAMNRCDAIVTNAKSVAVKVQQRCGYPASKVHVIPNGIDSHQTTMSKQDRIARKMQLGAGPKSLIVGSVGRLVPVKGFDLAVRAISQLVNTGLDCHLLLVGEGPLEQSLASLAKQLGLRHRVHLLGHQAETAQWYELMDVYINTSHSEGMSQSLVEAMAAGCPIIATDVGDSAVVVGQDHLSGQLIEAGNTDQLADAISRYSSDKLRCSLSKYAVERHAKEFSSSKMAQRYTDLYQVVLAQRKKAVKEATA